jgi:hypothetical protein
MALGLRSGLTRVAPDGGRCDHLPPLAEASTLIAINAALFIFLLLRSRQVPIEGSNNPSRNRPRFRPDWRRFWTASPGFINQSLSDR